MGTTFDLKTVGARMRLGLRRCLHGLLWLLCRLRDLVFNRYAIGLLLGLCVLDLCLELRGLPRFLEDSLRQNLRESGVPVEFESLRAGVVRGLVVDGIRLEAVTPAGPIEVSARHASLRPYWFETLCGTLTLRSAEISGCSAVLRDGAGGAGLELGDLSLAADLASDGKLYGHVVCLAQGVEVGADVEFSGAGAEIQRLLGALDQPTAPVQVDPALQARIAEVGQELSRILTRGSGSRVRLSFRGEFARPEDWSFKGYANLRNLYFSGFEIPRCSVALSGTWDRLVMDSISVSLGAVNSLRGRLCVYPLAGELEGQVSGELSGWTALRLYEACQVGHELSSRSKLGLAWILRLPLKLSCTVERSPMTLEGMKLSASLGIAGLELPVLGRCSGQVAGGLEQGRLTVESCRFSLDNDDSEYVSMTGGYTLATGACGLSVEGRMKLPSRLQMLGVHLSETILALEDEPCRLSMSIRNEGGAGSAWSVSGSVSQPELSLLGVSCREAVIPFSFHKGKLTLSGIRAEMSSESGDLLSGDVSVDLSRLQRDGLCRVAFEDVTLLGRRLKQAGWGMAAHVSGSVDWCPATSQLSFDVHGKTYPDRLYQNYLRHWDLDSSRMLMQISCSEGDCAAPMSFRLRLPRVSLESDAWQLQGDLAFGRLRFNGLPMKELVCSDFEIGPHNCTFRGIHGVTGQNDVVDMDLRVEYAPFKLLFSRAVLTGDPRIVGFFLMNSSVRDTYLGVFKDISWSRDVKPTLRIPLLTYQDNEGGVGTVTCEGIHLHARHATYLGFQADDLNAVVSLELPQRVVLETVNVRKDDWWLGGRMELGLQGVKQCRFQIYDTLYGVDMGYLIRSLAPELWADIKELDISRDCKVSCQGSMFLDGEPRLRLDGKLQAKRITVSTYGLDDVDMDWSYDGGRFGWQLKTAHFLGGLVRTSGAYDLWNNRGNLLLRFAGLPLDACYRQFAAKADDTSKAAEKHYKGEVKGELNISLLRNWAGRDWHLDGAGHVAIRKADLWGVPLLSALSKLFESATFGWLSSGLGTISELDADLSLSGANVMVPHMRTNGTIMSLRGSGGYRWTDDWRKGRLQFLVSGIPVQEVKILSFMLSSLTGMFQAELTGTLQKNSWKMRTFIDMLF